MAAKMSKADFQKFAKAAAKKLDPAAKRSAHADIDYGFRPLPAGIRNGVAKLTEIGFDNYKEGKRKGEMFFFARALVLQPTKHEGEDLTSRKTSQMIHVGSPETATEDANNRIANLLKILSGNKEFTGNVTGFEDYYDLCEILLKKAPTFEFSTSVRKAQVDPGTGKPMTNPETGKVYEDGVWENWHRKCEYVPEVPSGAIKDSTSTQEEKSGPTTDPSNNGTGHDDSQVEYSDQEDLDQLLLRATEGDVIAQKTLTGMAIQAGMSEADTEEATSWTILYDFIKSPDNAGGEDEKKPTPPKKGIVVGYSPIDPKTGKKLPKRDCTVASVSEKKRTVTVTSNRDKSKSWENISWDDLEEPTA